LGPSHASWKPAPNATSFGGTASAIDVAAPAPPGVPPCPVAIRPEPRTRSGAPRRTPFRPAAGAL
jgi:hypothetical protein